MAVRLAHIWSSHFGAGLGLPLMAPFAARGWNVTVLCPSGPGTRELAGAGIEHVPIAGSRRFLSPMADLRTTARIAAECQRRRFDIVHTHNVKTGWLARLAASLAGSAPIVHTVHGMAFGDDAPLLARLVQARAERIGSRFCSRVLVQSNDDAESLLHAGVPARKLVYVGNGVSLVRFSAARFRSAEVRRELGVTPDEVLFVSAGRLVRDKGFVELAEAAARARRANPRVRVAIAGPLDPRSRQALSAAELERIAQHVELLGDCEDMPALLAAADVVVLASHHEGLPRILMEGAAMGRPLIATDARGCREVVNDPRIGTLVPLGAPNALARAMIELAGAPDRREQMGTYNREMAIRRFDVTQVVRRLRRVYREVRT